MTFEEFKKLVYPSKKTIDRIMLNEFVSGYANDSAQNVTAICNSLYRANICSLEALRDASDDDIRNVCHLGEKRLKIVFELRDILRSYD